VAQVVEHLSSKHEAQSSTSSIIKTKEDKNKQTKKPDMDNSQQTGK
jgi:hypothetical protein